VKRNPIFIGGANRSGTSLLFALLTSHPNLSIVQRTDMWRYFYGQFGDLSQEDNFERCLIALLSYRRITRLKPDPERIRLEFWQGKPTYGRLFALIHEHHAERAGKPRWGDKSLHTEHHADQIFAEFPEAKLVCVIRDPRDRFASEHRRFNASVATATAKWLASIKAVKHNMQCYPQRFLAVRYESLASHPEETLLQVCDFIDETYTPAMLTMTGAPEHLEQRGDSAFEKFALGEISTRSIGRFHKVISKREIALIQLLVGRYMNEFGYKIDLVRLSLGERLLFYTVTLPVSAARITRWLAFKKFRDLQGRRVRPHRVTDTYHGNPMLET